MGDYYSKATGFPYGVHEAHTARGWIRCDNGKSVETCGNYLDYERDYPRDSHDRGAGSVHAVAYYQARDPISHDLNSVNLGAHWFETVAEAQDWIIATVSTFIGQPVLI